MKKNLMMPLSVILVLCLPAIVLCADAGKVRQEALDQLYKAAKAEREVVWQVGSPVAQFKTLIDAFQKKYPGIKLSAFTLRGPDVPPRIITEAKAGKLSMDVAMGTIIYIQPLLERDLLVSSEWAKLSDVEPEAILCESRFINLYDNPAVVVYNKELVAKNDVPRRFEDLLDPKWKGGKIAIAPSEIITGQLYPMWNQDKQKVINILAQLRKQDLLVGSNFTEVATRVATGEAKLGFAHAVLLLALLDKGAPIGVCPITPTYNIGYGEFVPKGGPHPNAGKLLASWLMSQEARPLWVQAGRGRAAPCNAGPMAKLLCDSGVKHVNMTTAEEAKNLLALGEKTMEVLDLTPMK